MKFSKAMEFKSADSRYGRADSGRVFAELETDLKRFVSSVSNERGKHKNKNDWDWEEVPAETKNHAVFNEAKPEMKNARLSTTKMVFLNEQVSSNRSDNLKTYVGANGIVGAGSCINNNHDTSISPNSSKVTADDAGMSMDFQSRSTSLKECRSGQKRKRECLRDMLGWISAAARDPTSPAIGTIPERSKWKSFGNGSDQRWKQVLSAREATFLKSPEGTSPEQYNFQKRQRMHPSMFDDIPVNFERSRSSSRRTFLASSSVANLSSVIVPKRIPVGPFFQAELPEWTGVTSESDSKWLGTRTWPPEGKGSVNVSKQDGNTTNDPCVCKFPGSIQCIKYHINWERMKMRCELGSLFHQWEFNKMGEEVAVSWTKMEEDKFKEVVKANPWSLGKCFWDELVNVLPGKRRQELVSYYFNVFILRRRAHQNRYDSGNIDSDDDENELAG